MVCGKSAVAGDTILYSVHIILYFVYCVGKGKSVPLQAWTGPGGSRKLRLPDFVTTAQDSERLSAFTPGKCYRYSFLLETESTPGS